MNDRPGAEPLGLFGVAELLIGAWRLLVGLPLAAAVLALGASFLMPKYYQASASFVPESRSLTQLPAGLSALAGQLGLPLSGEPSKSPKFYADVLKSRTILERTVQTRFAGPGAADSVSLLDRWQIRSADSLARLARGVRRHSRRTPDELREVAGRHGLDGEALVRTSRLTARIDNNAIADGFQIYLHSFIVTAAGEWTVVQQGMNEESGLARRYHWHSRSVRDFTDRSA